MSLQEITNCYVARCKEVRDREATAGKEPGEYEEILDVIEGVEASRGLVTLGRITEEQRWLGLISAAYLALKAYGELSAEEEAETEALLIAHEIGERVSQ